MLHKLRHKIIYALYWIEARTTWGWPNALLNKYDACPCTYVNMPYPG